MAGGARHSLPDHVALIMDGNRRWAEAHGFSSKEGHARGVVALREIVRYANGISLKYLTLYGFSVNNWQRSEAEVEALMQLLRLYIRGDLAELHQSDIRVRFLGSREGIAADIVDLIDEAEALTADNRRMVLSIAFNYGSRDEIARALRRLVDRGAPISIAHIEEALDSHPLPPVDVLIRTGGEQRLSDFLLWQSAYAELIFVDAFWPDFTPDRFREALAEYAVRDRRFGTDSEARKAGE